MSYESFPPAEAPPERLVLRPPVGIPRPPTTSRVRSTLAAIGLHVLVLALILAPVVGPAFLREIENGGGAAPAGGGGGGLRGDGGTTGPPVVERLRFVQLAAPKPQPAAAIVPPTPPLPKPKPVVTPPVPPATSPTSQPTPAAPVPNATAAVPGSGGIGADGSAGSGPGTGAGVGSGVGAGRGGGVGPGTGGGNATDYTPTMVETFFPPWPIPSRVHGTTVTAVFDVDSTGHVVGIEFTPTSDGGYNRRLREMFSSFRFRPGTKPDGTPIRAKASFAYTL